MYSKQICRDILFALPALSCHELNFSKVRAGSGELVSVWFMPLQRRCWVHGHLAQRRGARHRSCFGWHRPWLGCNQAAPLHEVWRGQARWRELFTRLVATLAKHYTTSLPRARFSNFLENLARRGDLAHLVTRCSRGQQRGGWRGAPVWHDPTSCHVATTSWHQKSVV